MAQQNEGLNFPLMLKRCIPFTGETFKNTLSPPQTLEVYDVGRHMISVCPEQLSCFVAQSRSFQSYLATSQVPQSGFHPIHSNKEGFCTFGHTKPQKESSLELPGNYYYTKIMLTVDTLPTYPENLTHMLGAYPQQFDLLPRSDHLFLGDRHY